MKKRNGERTGGFDDPVAESALEGFSKIAARVGDRDLALFLDYDGTLTPIVERPEDAHLDDGVRETAAKLRRCCYLAIVSGRDRADVESRVGLPGLVYAGSHGFDISGPDGLRFQAPQARDALPALDDAERALRDRLSSIAGASIERKKFAISAHYRRVKDAADIGRIEAIVAAVAADSPPLRQRGGHKIFELQPDIDWHKGQAVTWLMEAFQIDSSGAVIYIGDDVTDEDAFGVLRDRDFGIGIRVGTAAQPTRASYLLDDCAAVRQFLERLLGLLQDGA